LVNSRYKLGLRAAKTALAVFICLLFSLLLHRPDGLFSTLAAVICMQHTYKETFNKGLHRLLGTFIGGVIGFVSLEALKNLSDYVNIICVFLAPVCLLIIIYICNLINHKSSAQIACVVLLSVLANHVHIELGDTLIYVINRILDTSMGVVIAMLVNSLIFPIEEHQVKNKK